jgi:outer membrane protein OmpA-like peptidoglycan-associated protein
MRIQPKERVYCDINRGTSLPGAILDSLYKPSRLIIRVFEDDVNHPLLSAYAVITSLVTAKSERVPITNGRIERLFREPDKLEVRVSSPGYNAAIQEISINLASSGKVYEFDAVLLKVSYSVSVRGIDGKTKQDIPGIQFTLTGPSLTQPISMKPDPKTGLATTPLPDRGTYQISSTAPGYNNFTQAWVVEKEHSDVLFQLMPKKTSGEEKPALPQIPPVNPAPVATKPPTVPTDSVRKPSILLIKAFTPATNPPPTSLIAAITSRKTGKTERVPLVNGQLERRFNTPDEVDILVSAAGYAPARRNMKIDITSAGKFYQFDAELDPAKIELAVWAVDSRTDKTIPNAYFTVSSRSGMAPVTLTTDPTTGQAKTVLPNRGSYVLTGTATGYTDVRKLVTLDSARNEARVTLTAKPPAVEAKPPVVETKPAPVTVAAAPPAPKPVVNRPVANQPVASSVVPASIPTTQPFGAIEKGKRVQLTNIYFDQSSPVLRPESSVELDQLYNLLAAQPSLRIEIRGYTDNQGDFDLNVQLSRERCQAVVNYLVGKGIAKSRLKAVGRGPLDAVAPNTNEENRRKNRRVEFEVLEL